MAYMNYKIVNSAGNKLSSYYPNDVRGRQLVYRHGDYMIFGTKAEAEAKLRQIQRKGIGKNLRIVR